MALRFLEILAPLATFLVVGAALQIILPRPLEESLAARFGYAFLLGIAWIGLASWTVGLLWGAPLNRELFLGTALAAIVPAGVVVALRRGRVGGWSCGRNGSSNRLRSVPLFFGWLLVVAASLALAADMLVKPVYDFDGRMSWGTQARYLQASESVLPRVLTDEVSYVIHPRYPILMPLVQVATVELAGVDFDGFAVRPLYLLVFLALVGIVVAALRRLAGDDSAGLTMMLFLSAPALLWNPDVGVRGTYSDLPLAAFLGGGFLVLFDRRSRSQDWRGAVGGLLLAAAVGTKNEGLILAPVVCIIAMTGELVDGSRAHSVKRGGLGASLLASIIVGLAVLLVVSWRTQIPNRNDESYLESLSVANVASGLLTTVPDVVFAVIRQSLDPTNWGAVFWIAPLLVMVGWKGLTNRTAIASLAWIGVHSGLAFSAYALAPDLGIVAVTWSRFIVQMLVPFMVVIARSGQATLLDSGWHLASGDHQGWKHEL
jgi:hypothetical protein